MTSTGTAGSRPADAATGRWLAAGAALLAAAAAAAGMLAWNTQQRVKALEAELVRRQVDSAAAANEALSLARQADSGARELAARMAVLEARVAETAMQRSQFEDLIQSLARSRDENVLADIDTAIRVALQQTAITGSVEPLLLALRQADERLARYNQPRLERVRRAVAQDLERARGVALGDPATLAQRLDDAIRLVDDLPLLAAPGERAGRAAARAAPPRAAASAPAPGASAPDAGPWREAWAFFGTRIWDEMRSLLRVTRIDQPEAMLLAPEQAFFLRENLKLRLLNARLALLSRHFDIVQSDLREAQSALDRYFDRDAKRTAAVADALRQVAAQARSVGVPRPDATLAAIAAASAGR
ncbi:MAG: uroporphyrinogen-III C-methyltransferase [Rubrivivax sp.]|nr:uroporphyrinogen-III C-methyltransferase [Rubrivivax sp.]MCA3257266.1 uroporphyrinogen-III C-methyltransferase [Rubrivivax sp.]